MKKILVVYAVKEEFVPIMLQNSTVEYIVTGVGKTNAAMNLTKKILSDRFDLVLNIGTVGTIHHQIGDIVICDKFVDRDLLPLTEYGVTARIDMNCNQQKTISTILEEWEITSDCMATCNTGDTFVSDLNHNIEGDVIDMESFALAMVCKEFNTPFISVKYVTDIVGHNSVEHWEAKLADARLAIEEWFLMK